MSRRASHEPGYGYTFEPKYPPEATIPPHSSSSTSSRRARRGRPEPRKHEHHYGHHSHQNGDLPQYNHNGHKVTKGIQPDGESGRKGIHPLRFVRICFRSTSRLSKWLNVLWPFIPAAIAIYYARPDAHLWIFILNYIAMIPAANLLGFAGQEMARKVPRVAGIILETTFGSIVEFILFMVLITDPHSVSHHIHIIRAAILGSILANLLLCLGAVFFIGGCRRDEQEFHNAVSEVGSNLMLVAGMGLVVPAVFSAALSTENGNAFARETLNISRATAVILLFAYLVFIYFQVQTHHSLYSDVLRADEQKDVDRHKDLAKEKLTLTECVVALALALTFVALISIFLVRQIEYIVDSRGISDAFLGLILIPLVEKTAEHLTAVDEAWDDQMNFALSHILGSCVQTALLNTPLVVIVGWGLGRPMDLHFETFDAVVLVLAILVVGNFLRDGKSNYLEGVLCVLVYMVIAISAFYYPNPSAGYETAAGGTAETGGGHRR
ncbi:hypothetical protein W97_07500 [Coniosporium apollinis CBS 100218]|uniref:Vacuolar calcium ion transporter n=1 Tax=Coniosporium apollinis (strain CBS 100218) TaxID=1168221 RepID=R7Z249_CONA1|nr:uncharacterized protein W97_07500 [Coniosporium apollinis CBS 100218]EON68242.1 hypothetical protein W97_07500 [Coniosporium apollinis CBS 100218]